MKAALPNRDAVRLKFEISFFPFGGFQKKSLSIWMKQIWVPKAAFIVQRGFLRHTY